MKKNLFVFVFCMLLVACGSEKNEPIQEEQTFSVIGKYYTIQEPILYGFTQFYFRKDTTCQMSVLGLAELPGIETILMGKFEQEGNSIDVSSISFDSILHIRALDDETIVYGGMQYKGHDIIEF